MNKIPVFVINTLHRTDRKEHIIGEFQKREEFDLNIMRPIADNKPNISLILTAKSIIRYARDNSLDYIVICEDDHQFTNSYSEELLNLELYNARQLRVNLVSGGVSNFGDAYQISKNMLLTNWFWGTQFVVLFKESYNTILAADVMLNDALDAFFSRHLSKKAFFTPFISVQRDFGYSDVTLSNNKKGLVDSLFRSAESKALKYIELFNKKKDLLSMQKDGYIIY